MAVETRQSEKYDYDLEMYCQYCNSWVEVIDSAMLKYKMCIDCRAKYLASLDNAEINIMQAKRSLDKYRPALYNDWTVV